MASLADQFTDLQIDEMKEAFSMFDRNRDGNVVLTLLPTVFRTLGIHMSDSEIKVGLDGTLKKLILKKKLHC